MFFSSGNSLAVAEKLERNFPDQDLMFLDLVTLECLIKSKKIDGGKALPLDCRENVLKSVLWHWMRLREPKGQSERRSG